MCEAGVEAGALASSSSFSPPDASSPGAEPVCVAPLVAASDAPLTFCALTCRAAGGGGPPSNRGDFLAPSSSAAGPGGARAPDSSLAIISCHDEPEELPSLTASMDSAGGSLEVRVSRRCGVKPVPLDSAEPSGTAIRMTSGGVVWEAMPQRSGLRVLPRPGEDRAVQAEEGWSSLGVEGWRC